MLKLTGNAKARPCYGECNAAAELGRSTIPISNLAATAEKKSGHWPISYVPATSMLLRICSHQSKANVGFSEATALA